ATAGIDERSVAAIVNTHLHFDHCGQNDRLPGVPVWVTQAELDTAASTERYTVPAWADIDHVRQRVAGDGEEIATGVRLLATPGHTPGHQSVVVTVFDERPDLIVGQACYSCAEFADERVADGDLHSAAWREAARASLVRLRSLRPSSAYFSHDSRIYCSP
ncbi:MAG: MBL fold metallo-hydrolase, partial [Acidimicrobiia bacterium]|nr:MBL fold metallo-hydrolase [Acidimicrobiia bacterium]